MGLIIDATPSHPTPFVYFAHAWPRRDGDDIRRTTLKYARPLHNYEIPKIYYPIPCKFFEDLCQKDFWDGFVSVYMDTGQALHIGKFSAGGQQRNMVYVPGMPIWNARPPPPNDPPVVIMPATRDSVVADSIHRSRLQDQSRARAALLTARTSLTNWRVRFNRKKNKHDWHDAERERIRQNVQEEVDLPGSYLALWHCSFVNTDELQVHHFLISPHPNQMSLIRIFRKGMNLTSTTRRSSHSRHPQGTLTFTDLCVNSDLLSGWKP